MEEDVAPCQAFATEGLCNSDSAEGCSQRCEARAAVQVAATPWRTMYPCSHQAAKAHAGWQSSLHPQWLADNVEAEVN